MKYLKICFMTNQQATGIPSLKTVDDGMIYCLKLSLLGFVKLWPSMAVAVSNSPPQNEVYFASCSAKFLEGCDFNTLGK
jgi:hypothetical protein